MNPDLTPLKTYITSQRANNKTDEAIAASLTAAGWQADMVAQAFDEMQHENDTQTIQPTTPVEAFTMQHDEYIGGAIHSSVQPQEAESVDSQQQQSMTPQVDVSAGYRKRVKIIAKVSIALGVIAMISGIYPEYEGLLFFSGVVQAAIGLGLLAFKKIAYTLFNIFVILMVVVIVAGLILSLASPFGILLMILPFNLLFTAPDIGVVIDAILILVLGPAQLIFYLYGGLYLHKKEVRSLFTKKQ